MNLITVFSSNISQIGFEGNKVSSFSAKPTNVLRIVFTTGETFDYYGVVQEVYESFLDARSKGEYFHKFIKGVYTYEKVG